MPPPPQTHTHTHKPHTHTQSHAYSTGVLHREYNPTSCSVCQSVTVKQHWPQSAQSPSAPSWPCRCSCSRPCVVRLTQLPPPAQTSLPSFLRSFIKFIIIRHNPSTCTNLPPIISLFLHQIYHHPTQPFPIPTTFLFLYQFIIICPGQ